MAKDEIKHRVFVIGGSAGSLTMVLKMLPWLQLSDVSLIIIFHRKQSGDDVLIDILRSKTRFLVKEADDKDLLLPGVIYIAPADYHVLIEKEMMITLDDSEKVNYSRPSIDVTFESAAEVCGTDLVCFLLSGANADGVNGLRKAKALGAKIVVQDPASAEVSYMPQKALEEVEADLIFDDENLQILKEV